MTRKRLDDIQDGVIIDADIRDADGTVLVEKGTILNQGIRRVLNRARIVSVAVTEESAGLADLIAEVDDERRHSGKATRIQRKISDRYLKPDPVVPKPAAAAAGKKADSGDSMLTRRRLLLIASMFNAYKEDGLMRSLCRLAIKSAMEDWVRG